jgi:hypothetical protein
MNKEVKLFLDDYSREIFLGKAAYFIGSGISVGSKVPDWSGLLKPFAQAIGISELDGKDLPLVAQYIVNEGSSNRGPFINKVASKLKKKFAPNNYHRIISKTKVSTIWTTNYDNLLEQSYSGQTIDLKVNDDSIGQYNEGSDVEIIKMHGCVNHDPNKMIITQSDYEDFFINRPAISQRLRVDLLQKSFLFLGYSYRDPNIQNIITEARRLSGNFARQHYLITKAKKEREFELWCKNLERYGIKVLKIDDFPQLEVILSTLSLKSRGKSVFITGSHKYESNEDVNELCKFLAGQKDVILNDGQSTGVMAIARQVYIEAILKENMDIQDRIRFFPNPYAANPSFANNPMLLPQLKEWRSSLLRSTHVLVAFDGGMGTESEIQVALEMGCIIIPFFKNRELLTWKLLDDNSLISRLNRIDETYLAKVSDCIVTKDDLIALLTKIFNE